MPSRIEDYALIGDCQTAALVGRDGSIDWLCLPRFDSRGLLRRAAGRRPRTAAGGSPRRARSGRSAAATGGGTLVLETEFETDDGRRSALIDFMPPADRGARPRPDRRGASRAGADADGAGHPVRLRLDRPLGPAGPTAGSRRSPGPTCSGSAPASRLRGEDLTTVAEFTVAEGERVAVRPDLAPLAPSRARPRSTPSRRSRETEALVARLVAAAAPTTGAWREAVVRSLITLKALTYAPTGGIVAAADHLAARAARRRAELGLPLLLAPRRHLHPLRAARRRLPRRGPAPGATGCSAPWPGSPRQLQIMYGLGRRAPADRVRARPGSPATRGRRPVRVGNAAYEQFQLDVYGEVIDALLPVPAGPAWSRATTAGRLGQALLDFLETAWDEPDEGIWEVRGPRRHFTHSKVMAWVAFDRAVKVGRASSASTGPVDRWRAIRDAIHDRGLPRGVRRRTRARSCSRTARSGSTPAC